MPKGKRPLPDELKVIHGTDQPSRMNPDQPKFDDTLQVPQHFDDDQREAWMSVVPNLIRAGVAKDIDESALTLLIEKQVEWRQTQNELHETGMLVRAPSGYPMMNPLYTITMQLGKELRQLYTEFGMTPSSRTRITVEKGEGKSKGNRFSGI